jgi:hypothetical protein
VVHTSYLPSNLSRLPVPFTPSPTIIYIFLQHLLPTFCLSQSSIPLTSHLLPTSSHVPTLTPSSTIVYNPLQHLFSTFQPFLNSSSFHNLSYFYIHTTSTTHLPLSIYLPQSTPPFPSPDLSQARHGFRCTIARYDESILRHGSLLPWIRRSATHRFDACDSASELHARHPSASRRRPCRDATVRKSR